MDPWEGIVKIPAGRVGTYAIEHFTYAQGKPVPRSSPRTALLGGQGDPPLVFDQKTTWHQLTYQGGVWMTDLPIEQVQHDQHLVEMEGAVLVGGLGLGYAANVLAARQEVERVVVVEVSPEVVELVSPHLVDPEGKVEVVTRDLFQYLRDAPGEEFDWGFFDIWQSDGEGTLHSTVVPLRQLAEQQGCLDDDRLVCWNENVMRGQLIMQLQARLIMSLACRSRHQTPIQDLCEHKTPEQGGLYWNWAIPFWKAVAAGRVPGQPGERFSRLAQEYGTMYGRRGWQTWWDLRVRRTL